MSKHFLKSKQFWIGVSQIAGGISAGFLIPGGAGWTWGIPQALGGILAIIDRVFSEGGPVHVKKPNQEKVKVQ